MVEDASTEKFRPDAAAVPEAGRGPAIIDGTGLAWGVERHTGGKTVWVQGTR